MMGQVSERAMAIVREVNSRTSASHYRLVLNEERRPAVTDSKIGGKPYWPAGKKYPVDDHGNKMLMVMQVNCHQGGLKAPLPEQGMLQWFISVNDERMYGCRGNYDEDGSGFAIVYHSEVTDGPMKNGQPSHDLVDDEFTPVKREVAIDVEIGQTTMGVTDGRFNGLFFDVVAKITGVQQAGDGKMWYEYLDNDDCLYLEQQLGMKRPCHQMLGFPVYSQDEARRDIALHDTLLFQLDSQFSTMDRKPLVMWGDMGSGFVFINRDDLAALNFARTYYCWDCG